jgi:hypothetical protein
VGIVVIIVGGDVGEFVGDSVGCGDRVGWDVFVGALLLLLLPLRLIGGNVITTDVRVGDPVKGRSVGVEVGDSVKGIAVGDAV